MATAKAADDASDNTPEIVARPSLDELLDLWASSPGTWRPYLYASRLVRGGMQGTTLGQVDLEPGTRSWSVMMELARRLGSPQMVMVRLGKTTMRAGGEYTPWAHIEIDDAMFTALGQSAAPAVVAAVAAAAPTTKAAPSEMQELLAAIREAVKPKAEDPASMLMRLMEQADARSERQSKQLLDTLKTAGLIGGAPATAGGGIAPPSDPKFWLDMGEKIGGGNKGSTEIITAVINGVAPALQEFLAITRQGVEARTKLEEKRLAIEETKADTKLLEASKATGVQVGSQDTTAPAIDGVVVDDDAQQSLPLDDRAAE